MGAEALQARTVFVYAKVELGAYFANAVAGYSVCRANAWQELRIHRDSRAHASAGHRRKYSHFQPRQFLLLLRPLPVQDPSQIMVLGFRQQQGPVLVEASYPDWEAISQQADGPFSAVVGSQLSSDALTLNGKSYSISTNYVTGNYFEALGLRPTLGRLFLPSEGKIPGADPIIVLGYSFGSPASAATPPLSAARFWLMVALLRSLELPHEVFMDSYRS